MSGMVNDGNFDLSSKGTDTVDEQQLLVFIDRAVAMDDGYALYQAAQIYKNGKDTILPNLQKSN